jgi:YbbR domain-containing protein
MRDLLRRAFFENFALKAVAMILSITLFILVHGERDAVIAAYIPVVYSPMPEDRVLMNEPLRQVRVMVKGPWTRVKRFDERQVDPLYIDLSKVSDGEYSFQDDMVRLPPGLQVVSINPASIRLEFEKTATKVVAVVPRVEGDPEHGYKVDRLTARPSHVSVRGAKTVVDATRGIETRPVSVEGKRETFREKIPLAPTEAHLTLVEPGPVEIEVTIVEEAAQLKLEGVPIVLRPAPGVAMPPPGRLTVEPANVTLVLRGTKKAIESVEKAQVFATVVFHGEDLPLGRSRKALVVVEGTPPGVAVEAQPRDATLSAGKK